MWTRTSFLRARYESVKQQVEPHSNFNDPKKKKKNCHHNHLVSSHLTTNFSYSGNQQQQARKQKQKQNWEGKKIAVE